MVTTFGDAGPRRLVGNYDVSCELGGFFDAATGGLDPVTFVSLFDADEHYVTVTLGANGAGTVGCRDMLLSLSGLPQVAANGAGITINHSWVGRGGMVRSTILGDKTSTAAENLSGVNMGVTSSGTTFAVIYRVLAFSGSNITFTMQGSSDNGSGDTYAAISGLAETFTAVGVARDTITAATEAWKRVAITGTFSSATVLVSAGSVAA